MEGLLRNRDSAHEQSQVPVVNARKPSKRCDSGENLAPLHAFRRCHGALHPYPAHVDMILKMRKSAGFCTSMMRRRAEVKPATDTPRLAAANLEASTRPLTNAREAWLPQCALVGS